MLQIVSCKEIKGLNEFYSKWLCSPFDIGY